MNSIFNQHRKHITIMGIVAITPFAIALLIKIIFSILSVSAPDSYQLLVDTWAIVYDNGIDAGILILLIVGVVLQIRRIHTLNNHLIVWLYINFFGMLFLSWSHLSFLFLSPPTEEVRYILWTTTPFIIPTIFMGIVIVYVHTFRKKWPAKIILVIIAVLSLIVLGINIRNLITYNVDYMFYITLLNGLGYWFLSCVILYQGQHMIDWQDFYLRRGKDESVFGHHITK